MRRAAITLLGLALVMTVVIPAISQGWVGKDGQAVRGGPSYGDLKSRSSPADEPLLDSVMYASETLLARMPEDSYMIRPAVARRLIRERAVLIIDIRERAPFAAGRIPRAVNLPLRELSQALNRLPADKSTTIIVYCGNGDRGGMALAFLRLWGYTNAFSIVDGINGWTAAGLPVETPDPGWPDRKLIVAPSR